MSKAIITFWYLGVLISTASCLGRGLAVPDAEEQVGGLEDMTKAEANQLLREACINGSLEDVQTAIDQNADVNCRDEEALEDALNQSPRTGRAYQEPLIVYPQEERNELTPLGLVVFHAIADDEGKRPEIVRVLLAAGARVNYYTSLHRRTPLFMAVDQNLLEITKALLENDAVNVNALESNYDDYENRYSDPGYGHRKGRSPLFRAIEKQNEAILAELLKHPGIDVNICRRPMGLYPIHIALEIAKPNPNIIKALLNHPEIDVTTDAAYRPLGTPLDLWTDDTRNDLKTLEPTDRTAIEKLLIEKCADILYDSLAAGIDLEESIEKIATYFGVNPSYDYCDTYKYLGILTSIFEELPRRAHQRKLARLKQRAHKILENFAEECKNKEECPQRDYNAILRPPPELEGADTVVFGGIRLLSIIPDAVGNDIMQRLTIKCPNTRTLGEQEYFEELKRVPVNDKSGYSAEDRARLLNIINYLGSFELVDY